MIQLFIKETKGNEQLMTVRDSKGQIIYLIEGDWGRKDDAINLYKVNGTLLLQAKQTNFSPFFKFDLFQLNQKVGIIRKHPGLFGLRDAFFTVQPHNWVIHGDFDDLNFTTFKNDEVIMECTKFISSANYLYSLKVNNDYNLSLAALVTVLLDHYSRKKDTDTANQEASQHNFNLGFINYQAYFKLISVKEKDVKTR